MRWDFGAKVMLHVSGCRNSIEALVNCTPIDDGAAKEIWGSPSASQQCSDA